MCIRDRSILSTTIIAQSITVIVRGEKSLEINKIDAYVTLTETKFDFVQPEYLDLNIPKSINAEIFLTQLNVNRLSSNLIDTKTESNKYYERHTKKQQVKTVTTNKYQVLIKNSEDLEQFKNIVASYANIKITSTKFESKNEKDTLRILTEELLSKAKKEATKMAKLIGKKVLDVSNIKVLNLQTEGNLIKIMNYILEQKGHMELEVTFETE